MLSPEIIDWGYERIGILISRYFGLLSVLGRYLDIFHRPMQRQQKQMYIITMVIVGNIKNP